MNSHCAFSYWSIGWGGNRSFVILKKSIRSHTHTHSYMPTASSWEQGNENDASIKMQKNRWLIAVESFLVSFDCGAAVESGHRCALFVSYRLQINYLCHKRQSNQLRKSAHETICQTRSTPHIEYLITARAYRRSQRNSSSSKHLLVDRSHRQRQRLPFIVAQNRNIVFIQIKAAN